VFKPVRNDAILDAPWKPGVTSHVDGTGTLSIPLDLGGPAELGITPAVGR
jgi:hypothetical protein